MKKIIASTSVIMSSVGLPLAIINFINGHYAISLICVIWFTFVIYKVGEWIGKQKFNLYKQMFTLIELLAVITIMSILVSMILAVAKESNTKHDTRMIASTLKLAHTQSLTKEDPVKVELDNYRSEVTKAYEDVYFYKGSVVDENKDILPGCTYEVKDNNETPYIIKVNSFTGKVSVRIKEE